MKIVQDKAVLLRTRHPEKILSKLPGSKQVNDHEVAVKWNLHNTILLNQLGIKTPSPIRKEYNWPGKFKPYDHQIECADFLAGRMRAFNFSEQGTGKTAAAAWAADYLMQQGYIRRVLIICPVSVMDTAWRADLFDTVIHRTVDIAHSSSPAKRKSIVKGDSEFIIINYDGLHTVADEIAKGGFDLYIADEASACKNPSTARWKRLNKLVSNDPTSWLWMMTGTPAAQSPMDAFGLARMVCPERAPRTKMGFENKTMYKVSKFKWVPKPNAEKIVFNTLQPAIRFTKAECLDLPEIVYTRRDAPMSKQQEKYYKKMRDNMVMIAEGEEVSSANAAVNLNKLLQISSGAVKTDSGDVLEFDIGGKYKVLKEILEQTDRKVLIFVQYKYVIQMLHEKLTADGIATETISGKVKAGSRADIIRRFQSSEEPRVLVIQPQSASHGVTLTAADTIVWWGPTSSVETDQQANARIHRAGQKHSCTVIRLQSSPVEKHLYRMLETNTSVFRRIVDLYKQVLEE